MKSKLTRYIKDQNGTKTENVVRSVNITKAHQEFLNTRNLNLSLIVRDALDALINKGK